MKLTADYWNQRYQENNTPWDVGSITPPLRSFFDQYTHSQQKILIPGAGYAHEAIYLHHNGYSNVYVCDWAEAAITALQKRVPDFPTEHLLVTDYFDIQGKFDIIIEQTFFCALEPELRSAYARKTANLLQNKGILAGLLFAEPFPFDGPPFGGTPDEYRQLFLPYFDLLEFSLTEKSISPRLGRELFIHLQKKSL
jgi:hypothetical protein